MIFILTLVSGKRPWRCFVLMQGSTYFHRMKGVNHVWLQTNVQTKKTNKKTRNTACLHINVLKTATVYACYVSFWQKAVLVLGVDSWEIGWIPGGVFPNSSTTKLAWISQWRSWLMPIQSLRVQSLVKIYRIISGKEIWSLHLPHENVNTQ